MLGQTFDVELEHFAFLVCTYSKKHLTICRTRLFQWVLYCTYLCMLYILVHTIHYNTTQPTVFSPLHVSYVLYICTIIRNIRLKPLHRSKYQASGGWRRRHHTHTHTHTKKKLTKPPVAERTPYVRKYVITCAALRRRGGGGK